MNIINELEQAKRQERVIEQKIIKEKIAFIYMNAKIINEKASISELEYFFISTDGIKLFELYGLENNTPSYVDAIENQAELRRSNSSVIFDKEKVQAIQKRKYYYFLQAVDKVGFSNRLCHTAFYIPHKRIKKEQY